MSRPNYKVMMGSYHDLLVEWHYSADDTPDARRIAYRLAQDVLRSIDRLRPGDVPTMLVQVFDEYGLRAWDCTVYTPIDDPEVQQ